MVFRHAASRAQGRESPARLVPLQDLGEGRHPHQALTMESPMVVPGIPEDRSERLRIYGYVGQEETRSGIDNAWRAMIALSNPFMSRTRNTADGVSEGPHGACKDDAQESVGRPGSPTNLERLSRDPCAGRRV